MCAYWPVRFVARDGQHSGKLSIAWSKVVPSPPSSVFTFPMYASEAAVWSSVMISTTFTRASAGEAKVSRAAAVAAASYSSQRPSPRYVGTWSAISPPDTRYRVLKRSHSSPAFAWRR